MHVKEFISSFKYPQRLRCKTMVFSNQFKNGLEVVVANYTILSKDQNIINAHHNKFFHTVMNDLI